MWYCDTVHGNGTEEYRRRRQQRQVCFRYAIARLNGLRRSRRYIISKGRLKFLARRQVQVRIHDHMSIYIYIRINFYVCPVYIIRTSALEFMSMSRGEILFRRGMN